MEFRFAPDGRVSLTAYGREMIAPSPVGMILKDGELHLPVSSVIDGNKLILKYDGTDVVLDVRYRENGSCRIEVKEICDCIDGFVFGPYSCPDTVEFGEMVGAAWFADGKAVCIQSLNPKTVGECQLEYKNNTGWLSPLGAPAAKGPKGGQLSCAAENMTRPKLVKYLYGDGFQNVIAEPVEGPDGPIAGAAIVLTCAENSDLLLEDIGKLEIEENMPHPTIDGEWAKTSIHASDIYFVFGGGDTEMQVRMAEKANVHYIYFSDPFRSWGHFGISESKYPGGEKEFSEVIAEARSHGVNVGFHTLSNFIHTYDPYVTPVPHKELLAYDPTELTFDISETDKEIGIKDELNYSMSSPVMAVRIGDEIIRFSPYDKEKSVLTNCVRGAFGTKAAAHKAGEIMTRFADHSYGTLFPSMKLQGELADRIGTLIRDCKIRRMSFDGMEGCFYTGRGEYGASEYVRRVFEKAGNELLCDASGGTHYRWHAHSYFNWGEPWYDFQRLGGMYNYRARNQDLFTRNLMPGMLGWYIIANHQGRFEATADEMLEYILARTVAFNAGLCFDVGIGEGERADHLLPIIRLWQEFRWTVKVPAEIRERMKLQNTWWHLEKTEDKWILSELNIEDHDLGYRDNSLVMESGSTAYQAGDSSAEEGRTEHKSLVVLDRSSLTKEIPDVTEPLYCRVRIGTPLDSGKLHNFDFRDGWFGPGRILSFKIEAKAGDYLVYRGGKTLYHYDADYNLLDTAEGEGREVKIDGSWLGGLTLRYELSGDDGKMQITFKAIRTARKYEFPIK